MLKVGPIAELISDALENGGEKIPILELGAERTPRVDELQEELTELLDFNVVELVTWQNAKEAKEAWLAAAEKGEFTDPMPPEYDLELAKRVAGKFSQLIDLREKLKTCADTPKNSTEALRMKLLLNRCSDAKRAVLMATAILEGYNSPVCFGSYERYCSNWLGDRSGLTWSDLCAAARAGVKGIRDDSKRKESPQLTPEQAEKLRGLKLDAHAIAKWFRFAIEQYGFDYTVEVDPLVTAIDVRETSETGHRRVVIPSERQVDGLKLAGLIRHEIDCHARDSYNGAELLWGLGGGALRTEDDIIYEGHAMVEEHALQRRCTGESPWQALPWYTLAIEKTLDGNSFARVAEYIYDLRVHAGAKPTAALKNTWGTTYRVFRGMSRPDLGGDAFWKDKAYLQGTLEVNALYESGLAHWAELGSFQLSEIVELAGIVKYDGSELPHPDLNTTGMVLEQLLHQ